jgi:hypothetical protein
MSRPAINVALNYQSGENNVWFPRSYHTYVEKAQSIIKLLLHIIDLLRVLCECPDAFPFLLVPHSLYLEQDSV